MNKPDFEFWFDFASTYLYLSLCRITDLARKEGIAIEWKPFLLGPIFNSQGWDTSPFNIYIAKGEYKWKDLERMCLKYDIPFKKPSQFPRNGLLAARVALAFESQSWFLNLYEEYSALILPKIKTSLMKLRQLQFLTRWD
jgi:2-hydroxychromene-2-carboxylate isomerase